MSFVEEVSGVDTVLPGAVIPTRPSDRKPSFHRHVGPFTRLIRKKSAFESKRRNFKYEVQLAPKVSFEQNMRETLKKSALLMRNTELLKEPIVYRYQAPEDKITHVEKEDEVPSLSSSSISSIESSVSGSSSSKSCDKEISGKDLKVFFINYLLPSNNRITLETKDLYTTKYICIVTNDY